MTCFSFAYSSKYIICFLRIFIDTAFFDGKVKNQICRAHVPKPMELERERASGTMYSIVSRPFCCLDVYMKHWVSMQLQTSYSTISQYTTG